MLANVELNIRCGCGVLMKIERNEVLYENQYYCDAQVEVMVPTEPSPSGETTEEGREPQMHKEMQDCSFRGRRWRVDRTDSSGRVYIELVLEKKKP